MMSTGFKPVLLSLMKEPQMKLLPSFAAQSYAMRHTQSRKGVHTA